MLDRQERNKAINEGIVPMLWIILAVVTLIALGAWTFAGVFTGQAIASALNLSGGMSLVASMIAGTITGATGIAVGMDMVYPTASPVLNLMNI